MGKKWAGRTSTREGVSGMSTMRRAMKTKMKMK